MTRRQRTFLFLSLLALFALSAPALALYSQGYRVDFQNRRIAQTGAFYFKASPARADILVDGEPVKKTDFIFGAALTKNFFPGSYFVGMSKEGYHPWEKILQVKERQVTEAKNILLFPQSPAFQQLASNVSDVWISPDKTYALLHAEQNKNSFQLRLLNLATGGSEPLAELENSQGVLVDVSWSLDSRRFLLKKAVAEQIVAHVYGISANLPCFQTPCSLAYLGPSAGNIQFSPANPDAVLYTKFLGASQVLLTSKYLEKEAPVPLANSVVAFAAKGSSAVWLDSQGVLLEHDLAQESAPRVFQESVFTPLRETPYLLIPNGDSILVKENTALYLHERSSGERKEILSPITAVAISPDEKKAAISNQTELWVLYLKEETEQPSHSVGDLVLLTRFSAEPQQISWFGSHYIAFSLGFEIKAIEIDERDRKNTADIAQFRDPKITFDDEKGALYVLSQGAFSVSENLTK